MGSRKRICAENRKEVKKRLVFAQLNNVPISPRKMRLVADLVRNMQANKALAVLKYNKKHASLHLEKLLLSVLANWQFKNEGKDIEEAELYIQEIKVDGARMIKRMRPAPQGRGHRIRKRSNHVSVILGDRNDD
ncbi:50S ribosomal protein L22 [Bacteroidetes bacterium endosymbiont of Geopemphigus sp.]|uniref:50S ribosomal protein L22 n=1 Tax=Bacteroidetes bacterium endosymbiont of Geopemphigus sp. TaxID=2047937 RepID=UPI000CD27AF5|nr:50S ribosomal protein L22 [Bacteroidetes bacterium endosymbiont of Geopemphigus sp.]